jgi:hypothetical protein
VYANCVAHPNKGLVNALHHLIANKGKHEEHKAGGPPGSHGHGHSTGVEHGKSGQAPGHSGGHSKN